MAAKLLDIPKSPIETEVGRIRGLMERSDFAAAHAAAEQLLAKVPENYKEGLDQWRHFEPWLGPLKEALGDLAQR